jgi:hypothetical protein
MQRALAGLRLRFQRVALIGCHVRDFIKTQTICIDNSHTIDLQNRNGQTINFVRKKVSKYHSSEKISLMLFRFICVLHLPIF